METPAIGCLVNAGNDKHKERYKCKQDLLDHYSGIISDPDVEAEDYIKSQLCSQGGLGGSKLKLAAGNNRWMCKENKRKKYIGEYQKNDLYNKTMLVVMVGISAEQAR